MDVVTCPVDDCVEVGKEIGRVAAPKRWGEETYKEKTAAPWE
jgi:hypothetical protein